MLKKLVLTTVLGFTALPVLAEKVDVPLLIDIGLGPAMVEWNTPITVADQTLYALKFDASAYIEKKTFKTFDDKIPKDIPRWLLEGGVGVAPLWIPKTFYITPGTEEGQASVYGVRIAPSFGAGIKVGPLLLNGALGLDLTYMYMDSPLFDDKHFLRPGAHVTYEVALEPFKYLQLSVGQDRQRYWGQELSNGETLKSATETYFKVNIRIPYSINVNL